MSPDVYKSHATRRMLELEGVKLASFRLRALAFAIDFFLVAAVFVSVVLGFAAVATKFNWFPHTKLELHFNLTNWYSLVLLVLYFGVFTYLGNGQTLGKRTMGIKVVSTVHSELTFWHSIECALGYGASALELGFGFLQYFISDNRRTAHDRIAETIVVSVFKKKANRRIYPDENFGDNEK